MRTIARATGLGGLFLRAADPDKLHAWYRGALGIKRTEDGAFAFFSEGPREMTVFAFFPRKRSTSVRRTAGHVQLRVDDLDAVLEKLRTAGAYHRSQTGGPRIRPLCLV